MHIPVTPSMSHGSSYFLVIILWERCLLLAPRFYGIRAHFLNFFLASPTSGTKLRMLSPAVEQWFFCHFDC